MLDVLSEAIVDTSVSIAQCAVPEDIAVSPTSEGLIAEEQGNFSLVVTELSLFKAVRTDSLRGSLDSIIWVRAMPQITDGIDSPVFSYMPGSEWLLFLTSPLTGSGPEQEFVERKFVETGAESFLSSRNFYTVYDHSCGALCVYWPSDQENPPPVVAPRSAVEEIGLIVQHVTRSLRGEKTVETWDELEADLQVPIARELATRVRARMP